MSLSTHVLDAALGAPAADLALRLEVRSGEAWTEVAVARTGADGRVADLPLAAAGEYRLVFDTAERSDFYPEVIVTFTVADPAEHYHVPLLLSPYAYSTYRGS